MPYVDLDTVNHTDPVFHKYLARHKITMRILQEHGPGGGWPEIRYTGSRAALTRLVEDQFEDADLVEFIVDKEAK